MKEINIGQEIEARKQRAKELALETENNKTIKVRRNGQDFKIEVAGYRAGITRIEEGGENRLKNTSQARMEMGSQEIVCGIGNYYYDLSNHRSIYKSFSRAEIDKAADFLLQELSTKCLDRELVPERDLFDKLKYDRKKKAVVYFQDKTEKYIGRFDSISYIPPKGSEAYLVELERDPALGGSRNQSARIPFSRFLLPDKIDHIADFKQGESTNSPCCKINKTNMKISTLDEKSFWSVIHTYENTKVLGEVFDFLMHLITVAGLKACGDLITSTKGLEDKGMMSYLLMRETKPCLIGLQQCTDENDKTQIFAVPIKSRRRSKSGMKTKYWPEVEPLLLVELNRILKQLQMEVAPLMYSKKALDLIG